MHRQIGILGNPDHRGEDLFLGLSDNLGVTEQFKHSILNSTLTILEAIRMVWRILWFWNGHEPSPVKRSSLYGGSPKSIAL